MTTQFTLEYAGFVFIATMGVLQFVFALNGVRGMLFLRNSPRLSATLGILMLVAAFAWFFGSETRNISDTAGGLDGNAQARWFSIGAAAAIATTSLLSSMINHRWAAEPGDDPAGLEVLQQTTLLKVLTRRLRRLWTGIRLWTRR